MRLLLALLLLWCCAARAHDARPVVVTISETLPGLFTARLRAPPILDAGNMPVLVWPASCRPAVEEPISSDTNGTDSLRRCDGNLRGATFRLDYPQFNPSLATYYRLEGLDTAAASSALLAPSEDAWTIPRETTRSAVARDYLLLGVDHIIGGLDHLLFVLGLLVIARTPRRILLAVTGFTLAHSLTLALSSLGFVAIPIAPVEAVIALSILFLAQEIANPRADSLTWRQPLLVAFGFGLLHGLGFASALGEIGLVRDELLVSLLFFNLGVELGQLLFIAAVVTVVALLQRIAATFAPGASVGSAVETPGAAVPRRMDLLAAYIIGVPSAYWLIERVAGFL